MKCLDKVFVILGNTVYPGTILKPITLRGVVTGYEVRIATNSVNLVKQYIFVDEEEATKALFIKNLKKAEEAKSPAQDVRGDRHWIAGHKRSW